MAPKILFVSDEHCAPDGIDGGAAANTGELIKILSDDGIICEFSSTHDFNANVELGRISNFDLFIVCNFYFISWNAKEFLASKKYIITEHDYKFLATRNPCAYQDFLAPKEHIIHQSFYEKAQFVLVQSQLQKGIFEKNLGLKNLINFSGNLWSEQSFELLKVLAYSQKNGKAAILAADDCGIKGRDSAMEFCEKTYTKYDLIPNLPYREFLKYLSQYSSYIFFPRTPETLSRVCIEARLMNLCVTTSRMTGVVHEPFYNLERLDMFNYLVDKRKEILGLVKNAL